jgi:hypothetical protein
LDEKCKISGRNNPETIGYTSKQANKEWFDEECVKENEENSFETRQGLRQGDVLSYAAFQCSVES